MTATPGRSPLSLIHLLLVLVACLAELAAMAIALDWFDGNFSALLALGLASYFAAIFLSSLR
jgi:hypothetical protein